MKASWIGMVVVGLGSALAACGTEEAPTPRGLSIQIAPLDLPGIGDACFDLRVTNATAGTGDPVWTRGTPGNNGGTPDPGAVCSDLFGDGAGDVTYIGPCDASGQLDADPQGERTNSVTLWFDGLYDDNDAYIPPTGPSGWNDPCEAGCTLDFLCEENTDARVTFDLTVMRRANQGFFDVAVAFDDVFCSAKLDTCYEDGSQMRLLFGEDQQRDWTAVFGFACTAGTATQTNLHYGDLAVVCTSGATTTVFPINPVGDAGNGQVTVSDKTLRYGVYRGREELSCDDAQTPAIESCAKVYWNLAVSLDDLAAAGTCALAFAATATDNGRGFANGLPSGAGVLYPFIEVAATLSPPTCQRHALGSEVVRTTYRGSLGSAAVVMCSTFDGTFAGPVVGADCSDSCPNDPDKTLPGLCGCGVAELDTDGDLTADCLDACQLDATKTQAETCGCGASEADTDGDTVPDCVDLCATDPQKSAPGICGCDVPDTDSDTDGAADCLDECDTDPLKVAPGICGCDVADADSDTDGTLDCLDLCPNDPNKIDPGVCGCNLADTDSDTDGTLDCLDLCPANPSKIAPGVCGCALPDIDSDTDGTLDCNDPCPTDSNKIAPGICGCNIPDIDSDTDGTLDCNDACPLDDQKVAPGTCGCGVPDSASARLGGVQANAASSCVAIRDAGDACGDGLYWIDPNGGATTDATQVYCDMTQDGGGWMKVESATWPFWFTDSNWHTHNAASPLADNFSILAQRASFIDSSGCYEFRLQVGDGGNWLSAQSHELIWRQCHDPFTQTTDGADYTYISGTQPTTCGGFNGLHHKFQGYSYTNDPDLNDNVNCWWMQIVPKVQYNNPVDHPGYLEGFLGPSTHKWQSLWIRAAGPGKGREAPGATCDALRQMGLTTDGTYWLDPNGGSNSDAFLAWCDMTPTVGWTRVEGAQYPFLFTSANWDNHQIGSPTAANFSMLNRRALFASGGCTTWRMQFGDSGNWTGTPAHETAWTQCHDPFTQSTNGSGFTLVSGTPPSTCGGFNGLHHAVRTFMYTSDADSSDTPGCWGMQMVPHTQYPSHPGYYDGYSGGGASHQWQTMWVK